MGADEGLEAKGRTIEDYKEQLRRDDQQKKLLESVGVLAEKVTKIEKQQGLFCDPESGQCFLTRQDFETFMREQTAKIPQILGGHQDLTSLFRSLVKEGNKNGQDEAVQSRIPTALKARWVKEWCKDGECRTLLEKEGFEIEDDHKHKRAFPGS